MDKYEIKEAPETPPDVTVNAPNKPKKEDICRKVDEYEHK